MLTSCWCWWRTTCWSCYCCWFYEGETAVQAVVWGVSEPSQSEPGPLPPCLAVCLRTPSSAGLVVDPAEAQAILSSLFKFGIFVFVFVFISLVLVFTFSPPPSTCWLLTLLLFIVSTLQSFGLCFENLWIRSSGNMFSFNFKLNSHIVWKDFSGLRIMQKMK